MHVGKLCRDMPNKAVAEMERLHHSTVKDLDKLYMHATAPRATDTPAFELQIDSPSGNREITYPQNPFVVTPPAPVPTVRTEGCFFRLLSWMTRAYRSPNTPTNFDAAVKPGNAKSARVDLGFFMALP